MIAIYCALVFQLITFDDGERIELSIKDSAEHAAVAVKQLNYFSAKYGHEALTWAVSLKSCKEVPAQEQLERLGYFLTIDRNWDACR